MNRTATAVWKGPLKDGAGALTTHSKTLNGTPYSFGSRFGDNLAGTNPEELIAAAHAGCFSMALAASLTKNGLIPEQIHTDAILSLEQVGGAWTITAVNLEVVARVPGASDETFAKHAAEAKATCPVSRVLNATVSMTARLAS